MFGWTIAAAGAALVAQADDLNYRYVQCMFAVARNAPEEMPAGALDALLRQSCTGERAALHQVSVKIRRQRGDSAARAEASWRQVEEQGIESILRAHAARQALAR